MNELIALLSANLPELNVEQVKGNSEYIAVQEFSHLNMLAFDEMNK